MSLPNPSMSFTAFDILTAAEMNDLVENDQALAAGTGLDNLAIATGKIANGAVTPAKRSGGFVMGTIAGATFSSTGNKSVTGVGFTPKYVEFTALPNTGTANFNEYKGAMTASAQYYTFISGTTTGPAFSRGQGSDACIVQVSTGTTTVGIKASYVSMDADGFTINVSTASTIFPVQWIAYG